MPESGVDCGTPVDADKAGRGADDGGVGGGGATSVSRQSSSSAADDKTANGGTGDAGTAPGSKKDEPAQFASVREVFSFATTPRVKAFIVLSFITAAVSGATLPAMTYYFSNAFESLGASPTLDSFMAGVRKQAYAFMALGGIIFVTTAIQGFLIESAADEMTREMKNSWFRALLRQDLAFYDIRDVPGQASLITTNGTRFHLGVGRKLAAFVQFSVAFIGSLAYGLWACWQVTLALFAVAPLLAISTLMIIKITSSQTARSNESYAKAGSVVSTTVRSIRTILSLNAVEDMIARFKAATLEACEISRGSAVSLGTANGFNVVSMVLSYMIVTMFGAWLLYSRVRSDGCDPSGTVPGATTCSPSGTGIFGSLFAVSIAASILPQISISLEKFGGSRAACYPALVAIYRSLDEGDDEGRDVENGEGQIARPALCANTAIRHDIALLPKYSIDSLADAGLYPMEVKGDIEFRNVTFAYPARPDVNALTGFSLKIPAGQTVALVGPSGSGKSTVTALLERFYDVGAGAITLDGTDLRELNVKWLRQQIGLVMQEPKLFGKSIRENIAMGSPGVTQGQIEQAARLANAHDFIMTFPKGYDTQVGDLGGMLSGGQRQRIAIARVLVRKPALLILDEATSALDSESEAVVQQALDGLMSQRNATTIVIAHRLSTIKGADMIAVVSDGQIVETGSHSELIALNGVYASLVDAQKTKSTKDDNEETISENGSQHGSRHGSLGGSLQGRVSDVVSRDVDSENVFQFKNVHHRYPSRPDVDVFRGLNLAVRKGETLALVGPSGCGKSSVIQLMEHFYEPSEGSVLYHGVDLRSINVRWLRRQLGLVSQEATLFADTIEGNIKLGCPDASMDDVVDAAMQANCHDFISEFPDGYKTFLGEGGSLVSGGQKQRIAIARALLRKPKVLLLDEATSALDSKSEKVVQEALDSIMADKSRTVVVIAHRLSTIRNADRIAVIERGRVREIGRHDELMAKDDGLYRRLQQMQNLDTASHGLEARPDLHGQTEKSKDTEAKAPEAELKLTKDQVSSNSRRAWQLGREFMRYMLIGTVGAILAGLTFPAWGVIFAYMVELFYKQVACPPPLKPGFDTCEAYFDSEANSMRTLSFYLFYGYIGLCVTAVVGNITVFYGFSSASEKMNKKVRDGAFTSLIRQEVAFFDVRAPGTITSQLADDAAMLHAFAGEPIRTLTISVSSVVVGLVISFVYMWPFALLTFGILPFLAFGAEMEMKTYLGEDEVDDSTMDEHSPGGIVLESLSNIRTVASLTLEMERCEEYDAALKAENPHPIRSNLTKGSLSGVGQLLQMWSWAIMFWFGAYLLRQFPGRWSFTDFLISMFSLFFSMYGLTLAFQGAVDREKAKAAAERIFTLTDRKSHIDPLSDEGLIVSDDGAVDL